MIKRVMDKLSPPLGSQANPLPAQTYDMNRLGMEAHIAPRPHTIETSIAPQKPTGVRRMLGALNIGAFRR